MHGWMGRVLYVNLTDRKVDIRPFGEQMGLEYLGGRGLGARILYDRVGPGVKAMDPDSIMVFAAGPLTGTSTPMSGRVSLTAKSPLTGTIFDSNAGGHWGVRFKRCGFDALVITGKAPCPVYLEIYRDRVEIVDAAGLWGKETQDACSLLRSCGGKNSSALAIGPAGEHLVKFASISVDGRRSFGRGGLGAVMGSKHLKGIVVRGEDPVGIADTEKMRFVVYEVQKLLKANPITSQALGEFGTGVLMNIMNEAGVLPANNFRKSFFDQAPQISGEAVTDKLLVKRSSCHGCPVGCGRVTRTERDSGDGPEYETLWALGAQCGIGDLDTVAEANYLCNRLGLDTISTGSTVACAMELSERGDLPGDLAFGQGDRLKELIKQIAFRQGLGAELAEGSREFARAHGVEELAMQVKGLELPAYDPRGLQGQGLGFATSNRGGCHLRGNMLGPEILGTPKLIDRLAVRGKAGVLIVLQHGSAALDSLVMCKFSSFALGDEYFARLLTAVTGQEFQAQDLQKIGERIWNLERLYNQREGFGKKEDTLPPRLLQEPSTGTRGQGKVVSLEEMLEEYYRFRGWDQQGVPTPEKLRGLGLAN
ncbi:MAG: aldehyde ferredoxin oxidoreductase family protein [Bacillota bacterium]